MTKFEQQRIIEIVLYILNKTGGMDYYHLFKILYFANQRSLVDWGQLMIADKFCALPHGPVPTILYSTIQGQKSVLSKMKDDVYVVDYYLLSKREPDMALDGGANDELVKYINDSIAFDETFGN